MDEHSFDVVVVGGGNAALCAALAARETASRVLVLERAPLGQHGGNTAYTAGLLRFAFGGNAEILELVPDLSPELVRDTDFGSYPEESYYEDLGRVTEYRTDPELADVLVSRSFETMKWLYGYGVRFVPPYGRQAYKVGGKYTFWGGLVLEVSGGGPGLVDFLTKAARASGIEVWYGARGCSLVTEGSRVTGVRVRRDGRDEVVRAGAVVLACGGFEANAEMRARYLGPGWDLAKVRGTRYNTGDGIVMALEAGAMSWGNWSGAHAVGWDLNAPPFGDLAVGDGFQKHSYPFGIIVNALGERFVDEGADFRNYTYAKYGERVLAQPGRFAWQVFDRKISGLLRDEYRIRQVTKVTGVTLEELVGKMDGVDPRGFLATVKAFNEAVDDTRPFNPNVLDGRRTSGLAIDKSNWSNRLDEPPFEAYAITCGITFTFGGLKITANAEVVDTDGAVMPGLYACGELVGGLFYLNYPGGAGLMNGSVFGRIAGSMAGRYAAPAAAARPIGLPPKGRENQVPAGEPTID